MSNLQSDVKAECDIAAGANAIDLVIEPKTKELGGFSVRRSLPNTQCRAVGPWIFFDHMGPAQFSPGDGVNVRPHPHIGLATVTYLFAGEMLHRDSLGNTQIIHPGAINLMVAGRGIVHSERERPEVRETSHEAHGLQLWLALPQSKEDMEPAFYHYAADDIPMVEVNGVQGRVLIGNAYGVTSPVNTFSETLYVELHMAKGQSVILPETQQRAVYVVRGKLETHQTILHQYSMAVFQTDKNIVVTAEEDTQIAIIGGEPLGKRYMDWNFVSSDENKVKAAVQRWKEGKFPLIEHDATEYIPYPSVKRG